jgi:ornithine cyclodeaminase
VKAGFLHGEPSYAIKASSGFSGVDPPAIDGLVMVFDARTGAPAAFLLDNGYLTDLRTGAAGGVAARHLAPERIERVAVIGTGLQARYQVEALGVVRPGFTNIRVWGRTAEHADACVADLAQRFGPEVAVARAAEVEAAVVGAQVVITCTAAREPLVQASWLAPGAHVTAVGSDGAGKQELDPEILRRADLVAVDSLAQSSVLGELQHAPDQRDLAVELGSICVGAAPGRTNDRQLTVCDLTGLGVQDVAAATAVLAHAGDRGDMLEIG